MTWEEKCSAALESEGKLLGFSFSSEEREKMVRFGSLLIEWNQKMNLTGITDPEEVAIKHMLDSAVGAHLLPPDARVIDVGTGAGFPGVVLKILRPDVELVLFDSLRKRLTFLEEVISQLGLRRIATLHGRAEDAAKEKDLRESFDISVSRAVASLPLLSEFCLPFVRLQGSFLAWKGPKGETEIGESQKALSLLGGHLKEIHSFSFSGVDEARLIIEIQKNKETPKKFPRKPGSKPL